MEQSTALRAEWFASLSDAIEGAQRVAWRLRTYESSSSEARELYTRLEAARVELDSLRASAEASQKADPEWLRALGWSGTLDEPED